MEEQNANQMLTDILSFMKSGKRAAALEHHHHHH
nr:Chain B, Mediator of RNA polymerase II transcription subunit 8 [Schizosaccharomyces pombe]